MFFNVVGEAGVPGGNPANLYSTDGVVFSSDRLHTVGADLTGVVNDKLFSCSFWFKRTITGGTDHIWHNDGARFVIRFNTGNRLQVKDNGTIIFLQTSVITDTASWHHFMCSFDLSDTARRHAYVDGVSDAQWVNYTDTNIFFSRSGHAVGSQENSLFNDYDGELADFWWAANQYIDLGLQGNREKFRDIDGKPVDLASDGSKPTGTQPLVYFKGAASVWNAGTNAGSAQNFTMDPGSVTDSSADPP